MRRTTPFFRAPLSATGLLSAIISMLFSAACWAGDESLLQPSPEALDALQRHSEQVQRERKAPAPTPPAPSATPLEALERAQREGEGAARSRPAPQPPSADATKALEAATEHSALESAVEAATGSFSAWELRLDLEPETVLVTSRGGPFLTVQDFNLRVRHASGKDLYEARRRALDAIIHTRLVASLARHAGMEEHPFVEQLLGKAADNAGPGGDVIDLERFAVSDAEAAVYHRRHVEEFRRPDLGTRVRFAVRGSQSAASSLLARIRVDPEAQSLWLNTEPLAGSRLPRAIQDALFHAEPGAITEVVATPAGYYVARLVERNPFDHFLVQAMTFPSAEQARQTLDQVDSGELFGLETGDRTQRGLVPIQDLPETVQLRVREMEVGEVSGPIEAPLGVMVVKLRERWSDAPIKQASVVPVSSLSKGNRVLQSLQRDEPLEGIQPRVVSGDDLAAPLLAVARALKQGEYGGPVETDVGIFLIRVDERERIKYQSLAEARDGIKKLLRAAKIPHDNKREYYNANRNDYRLPSPRYTLDVLVSGGPEDGLTKLRKLADIRDPSEKAAAFDQAMSERGFEAVAAAELPETCQEAAADLDPGEVSGLVSSDTGHFVLRLREVEDPGYMAFDDVAVDIGALLADRAAEALQLEFVRLERDREIAIEEAEERALATAYRRELRNKLNTVSGREANQWWQGNRVSMLTALGGKPEGVQKALADGQRLSMESLKMNVLTERLEDQVRALYSSEQITVHEHLLHW